MKEKEIKDFVQTRYASIARGDACGCGDDCCAEGSVNINALVNYGDLLRDIVPGADLGLGCGIPTHVAGIKPGDTVLDLGSGAGVDVFLAAKAVGNHGRVIGVDMTPEMIAKAWDNAVKGGYDNVDFRLGDIEDLPVFSGCVDVVISNCVINLVPDKQRVFAEIFRVLKPSGHFTISDMVTYGNVPENIRKDMELWAGCVSGALDRDEYLEIIRLSGFREISIKKYSEYDAFKGDDYGIASITVEAIKV
ncbi:MAG: arsenite methyltransferase [Anaerolineales bacterium]|nr:arsenite methyltransferase [Anaerolineales bacterium]